MTPEDWLATLAEAADPAEAVERLAQRLLAEGRLHELFDVRLLAARARLGAPLVTRGGLEQLDEPLRSQVEEAYVEACREVGRAFLARRQWREAWLYLRPAGLGAELAAALAAETPGLDQLEPAIELAVYQALAPALGIGWVLEHYGTCTAISTIEGAWSTWKAADRTQVVERLIEHVHRELVDNVRRDLASRGVSQPPAGGLAAWVAAHGELFEADNYHLDTSHLHATVRLAREAQSPASLDQAWELTEYGRRLSALYQYPGEAPFGEGYVSHGWFFAAQLGRGVGEALDYFRAQLRPGETGEEAMGPAETLVVLLARLGRWSEAIDVWAESIPPDAPRSGWAPSLIELCQAAGEPARLIQLAAERHDAVGLAAGLLGRAGAAGGAQRKTRAT